MYGKGKAILDIMDTFPSATFLLFGDSGEDDLETYVDVALERPGQVAGIFIRNLRPNVSLQTGEYPVERELQLI
jgi:phosphatidate phosphatase APP1